MEFKGRDKATDPTVFVIGDVEIDRAKIGFKSIGDGGHTAELGGVDRDINMATSVIAGNVALLGNISGYQTTGLAKLQNDAAETIKTGFQALEEARQVPPQ